MKTKKLDGNIFYRIKKVKGKKKEMYIPQKKGMFGWRNIYYDLHFETLDGVTSFLDEYVVDKQDSITYIDYHNIEAKPKFDIVSKILHILCKDL